MLQLVTKKICTSNHSVCNIKVTHEYKIRKKCVGLKWIMCYRDHQMERRAIKNT